MRVFEHRTEAGELRVFEVENFWLGRRGVVRVIRSIPGAHVTRADRSWWGPDEFCEFELNGVRFTVDEPFGDNSRYLVAPAEAGHEAELLVVRETFLSIRRPEWFSGGLLTSLMLLAGASLITSPARPPAPFGARQVIAAVVLGAGSVGLVSWALALVRGHYRNRAIDEFSSSRRRS